MGHTKEIIIIDNVFWYQKKIMNPTIFGGGGCMKSLEKDNSRPTWRKTFFSFNVAPPFKVTPFDGHDDGITKFYTKFI